MTVEDALESIDQRINTSLPPIEENLSDVANLAWSQAANRVQEAAALVTQQSRSFQDALAHYAKVQTLVLPLLGRNGPLNPSRDEPKGTGAEEEVAEGIPVISMSTLFLRACKSNLSPAEKAAAIAGVRVGHNSYRLDHIRLLKPASAGTAHVRPDPADVYAALTEIVAGGEGFYALFHSHPGTDIPRPSGTDEATQENLEKGGYQVISGIFTESGFIHFFTHARPFSVKLIGEGYEVIDETTFRLSR